MRISTFNIQNDYRLYDKNKSLVIYNYLKKNKIDVLGLQEVFNKCGKDLAILINNLYSMVGDYRFFSKILLKRVNEKNPIITDLNIVESKTYHLPHWPSLVKRVITHIIVEYKGKEISIYNTHLEVKNLNVKSRQLKKIYELLVNDKRNIILMGDFNLKTNNSVFNDFVSDLEKIGLKRIPIDEKTLKLSRYSREIDHIFISNSFEVKSKEVIKDLDISDHYPVIVELDI